MQGQYKLKTIFAPYKFISGVSAARKDGKVSDTIIDLVALESSGAVIREKCAAIPDLGLMTAIQQISRYTAALVSQNEVGNGAKDGARTRDLRRDRATL